MANSEKLSYVSVVLDNALEKLLDYAVPKELQNKIKVGQQVRVPLASQEAYGIVWEIKEKTTVKAREIYAIEEEQPLIDSSLRTLAMWLSSYYAISLRKVVQTMIPTTIRKTGSHKEQYFVTRVATKQEIQDVCRAIQESNPPQAKILEILLQTKGGIFLTELLEKAGVTKSPVMSLVKKKLIAVEQIRLDRSPLVGEEYFTAPPKKLNEEQQIAFQKICASLEAKKFDTHLIYGITGSGKTEIYLQAIQRALDLGMGAIMLVPEISLTPQMIERFRSRFEGKIALLHHKLSQGERFDEWHRMARGEAQIALGARSAIFSPIPNVGIIIVDEEHESAYKQSEESFSYHARDVAVMRGKIANACVLLGSATPSLESMHNANQGKYKLSELQVRAEKAKLPAVTLVDMKSEHTAANRFSIFSPILAEKMKEKVEIGEQVILFLNRRGYHTTLTCQGCANIFTCPHCDIALTFHRGDNTLACHLCDKRITPPPRKCEKCGCDDTLKYQGIGTEQVERALHALIPTVRSLRIDSDTTRHKGSLEKLMQTFRTQKADVLIGTQMVAKGLHFPAVTLVAVLNGDAGLHVPDFRSSEKVFQMITQVSGRAGRGELPGEVIIQTQMPDHETIKLASVGNFKEFYEKEMQVRELFSYPPYNHFVKLTFISQSAEDAENAGNYLRNEFIKLLPPSFLVHPVTPSGHPKIKEFYRFQLLIRGKSTPPVCQALQKIPLTFPKSVRMMIDVDPISTFF